MKSRRNESVASVASAANVLTSRAATWAAAPALVAFLACGNLSPSADTDPCVQIGELCDACKLPADQQDCQDAIASADPAQCAAVLDRTGFRADCVVSDGGADAASDSADAMPPAACGTQASADAGCTCSGTCAPTCPGGGCTFTCASGTCAPTCAGGHCKIDCMAGATCESSCSGGDCTIDCKGGAQCANTCSGGGCDFVCEDNAVCNDTCGSATTCVGM